METPPPLHYTTAVTLENNFWKGVNVRTKKREKTALWIFLSTIFGMAALNPAPLKAMDIKIGAEAGQAFDDNVTFSSDNRKSDSITTLTGRLGVLFDQPQRQFELSGDVVQQLFAKNSDFNNLSENATLVFNNEFTERNRVRIRNVFSHFYEPRSFEESFGRAGGRFAYYKNRFNLDYIHELGERVALTARYGNELDRTERAGNLDSYLNRGGLDASYSFSSSFQFLSKYSYMVRQFDPGNEAQNHRAAGGFRKYLTAQVYVDALGGANFAHSYNRQDYSEPYAFFSITDDFSERTHGSLSYTKDYEFNHYSQDVFDFWRGAGDWTLEVSERTKAVLGAFVAEGTYVASNVKDKLWGGAATLSYDVTTWSKVSASYTYTDFKSNDPNREYVKNRIFLALGAEF